MTDCVDQLLEELIGLLPQHEEAIRTSFVKWRISCGGTHHYIGKTIEERRDKEVQRLRQRGLSTRQIAELLSLSQSQVVRILNSRTSSYL